MIKTEAIKFIFFVLFMVIGIIFMSLVLLGFQFGLELIPSIFFLIGATLFSLSIFCLWRFSKKTSYVMIISFISAFFITSIPFLRFNFFGTDIAEELYVAETTQSLGFWPISRIAPTTLTDPNQITGTGYISHQYFSSLSVTVLPASVSSVTGLPMIDVFRILVPLVSALCVLGAFLILRRIFGSRIALLSCIVFALHFIFGVYTDLLREDVALLFFFLAWYLILRQDRKSSWLAMLFIFSIPWAHYTVAYFLMIWVAIMYASERLYVHLKSRSNPEKIGFEHRRTLFPVKLVIFTLVACLAWFLFVATSMFSANVTSFGAVFDAISGVGSRVYSYQIAHIVSSSLGPLHTYIKIAIEGLTGIGFLYAFTKMKKGRSLFTFTFWGGALLVLILLWVVIPDVSSALNPDRVYAIALLSFSAFIALSLNKLMKKSKVIGTIIAAILIMAIFLDAVGLPIYYTSSSQLTPQTRYLFAPDYQKADVSSALWIQNSVNNSSLISSDNVGVRLIVAFGQHMATMSYYNSTNITVLAETVGSHYFFLIKTNNAYYVSLNPNQFFVNQSQIDQLDQIYYNGRDALTYIP